MSMDEALELVVKRPLRVIPESEWTWPSEAAAIADMIAKSGLQEKTIAIEAGIDASTLAKVKQGTARPSEAHLRLMMDASGSEAWIYYWLLRRGYDPRSLRRIESDVERENRELRERLAALEREREIEMRLMRELRSA
jgi:transcriptional regulator with XRE-family HTH domain